MAEKTTGSVAFERAMIEEKWAELKARIGDQDAIPFLVFALAQDRVSVAGADVGIFQGFMKDTVIEALEAVLEMYKRA